MQGNLLFCHLANVTSGGVSLDSAYKYIIMTFLKVTTHSIFLITFNIDFFPPVISLLCIVHIPSNND